MNRIIAFGTIMIACYTSGGQSMASFADSIRKVYQIPELGYAVVSSSEIMDIYVTGETRLNSGRPAQLTDQFRIGSNTKTVTGFIAAQLVKQGKISWDTKFFDLFPELKPTSNRAYHHLTLLNLLTFRTRLYKYTYTYRKPSKDQFTGTAAEQRYQFAAWFFQQKPVKPTDSINFSNLGYIAAGLMLEKASGKPYTELVADLGKQLDIHFGFGAPNATDTLQPWGHDENLIPERPKDDYKLNWLQAAGNIHVSLPDYARFIQLQLQGMQGRSALLTKEEFLFLHHGLPRVAVGWFRETDENGQEYSWHTGNPGTFLTKVFVYKDTDRAYLLFANAQTEDTESGLEVLIDELKKRYGK